ncbi:O-antigen ligase family protein [Fervidibacillus halotolerans]|uniref:O-antigen ligase family protein n=1 Tax=Fervidibacillus halotolerans TaxID=2980027 RepID=A0A9E8LYK1_9BACI|nr:O-antigen ligase family protein [Fervidibacillus halotolerans]WAA12115.1 O-antigen ligase family protein [Fervidibacillus halotolerans]
MDKMKNNCIEKFEITKRSSFKAKLIGLFFFLSLTSVYVFPDVLTNMYKPLLIILLFFSILLFDERLEINVISVIIIISITYYSLVLLNNMSFMSFTSYASITLPLIIALILSTIKLSIKDLRVIINSIYLGGIVFSIFILVSNPNLTQMSAIYRTEIKYLNSIINANGIPYFVIPAVLIGINKIILSKNINKIKHIMYVFISMYPIFYSMSRGGFLALFLGMLFIILYYIKLYLKKNNMIKIITLILLICTIVLMIYHILPQKIKARLFNFSSYDLNHRDFLWEQAILMSRNNIFFGNGYTYYWEKTGNNYGAHNLYIDLLVSSGIIGAVLMLLIFITIILKSKKNPIAVSFITIAFINSMIESGRSYGFWIPLMLALMIIKNISDKKVDLAVIFKGSYRKKSEFNLEIQK